MQTNTAGTRGNSIDFAALSAELLSRIDSLLPQWLPGGQRAGLNYKGAPQSSGGDGDSWVVNLKSGVWAHFAGDEKGGDLISLYAAIYGRTQLDAAKELIRELNLAHVAVRASGPSSQSPSPKQRAPNLAAQKPISAPADRGEFVSITPVPPHANQPPKTHPYRGTPERVWHYQRDGQSLGYVYRFATSDGGKDVIPLTWCQSQANDTQKWTWKTWTAPRPLYLAGGTLRPIVHRLIVEGEKCADAAHALLGEQFDVLSWPGGGKAEHHADWSWIAPAESDSTPRRAYLWPDCDAKRRKPSPEEKAAGVDPATLPLLPEPKQPGHAAMGKIAHTLHALGVEVWLIPIPKPLEVPDGWDVADAVADGWDAAKVQAFIDKAQRWEPEKSADEAAKNPHQNADAKPSAGAGRDDDGPRAWRIALIKSAQGNILAIRENIVLALQSIPSVVGNIAFNEFANTITKLVDMPWGSPAGNWTEVDELLMGEWLTRSHYMPSVPRGTLEEAIRMVATRHQYHPVRAYLGGLKWDKTKRLNTWLARAVCAEPEKLTRNQAAYMARVGAWFLMGMVARAMQPGCKFDYMPIFEGSQGMRKSTILNVLAGEWFADTGFVLGDKDSLQMLQGRWLYEISELDAMARAEVTKIKAFVASKADWYRASFDKRPREYPRQLVFAGTTNEHQYLVDGTGNRRFWPIDVTRIIDTEWVGENRDQLFAEAKERWESGERFHPTQDEELRLFLPQQRSRMVESPIEVRLLDYLVNNHDGMLLKEVKIVTLLAAIGIDITKLGPGRFHEKQAGTALKKFGWIRTRSSKEGRPWVYIKPDGWPACMSLDDLDDSPPR